MSGDGGWDLGSCFYENVVECREEHDRLVLELLRACKNGDLSRVIELLTDDASVECDVNVNSYDNDDTTPLQVAAANGHVHVMETLLERGADPLLCNQLGWTPMMHAAYHGHADAVQCLINAHVHVNTRSFLENCPLKLAAREGHTKVVKMLLDDGALLDIYANSPVSNDYNITPLMVAVANNHDDIVQLMLERGADANAMIRPTGVSVLMLCVQLAELTTAQMLLNHGADPEITDVLGQTAYDLAIVTNRRDMMGILEPYTKRKHEPSVGTQKHGIMKAVFEGNKSLLEDLLKSDSSLADFVCPLDGSTPLIVASMLGRLDMVGLLIARGASMNRQDKKAGWTALMQATYHGKPWVAKYLIHEGADVNLKSYDGYTAFDLAAIAQMPDDGGLLSLLAYRIAEQNVTRTHRSRHFLAFLFRANRNGDDGKHPKPLNWWRKLKSRFRRTTSSSVRRSASVANFHSTSRARSSLSAHEMTTLGGVSKVLKNSVFYSCDDLLRVQSIRRCSFDGSVLRRVAAPDAQTSKVGMSAIRRPTAFPVSSLISPVPPFCAPPFFTVDTPKCKISPTFIATLPRTSPPTTSTTGNTSSTMNFARSIQSVVSVHRNGSSSVHESGSVSRPSTSASPPSTEYSALAKSSSLCWSSDQKSVASINAARLGPGKTTPPRVPLSKTSVTNIVCAPVPKKASSACDLNLKRTTTPNHAAGSANSSSSAPSNANRSKRPQTLYINSNGRKPRGARVLRRPHSYHDTSMLESGVAYAVPVPTSRKCRPAGLAPPPLVIGRPNSYQEPGNSSQTLNDLPITPTRKWFNFFASDVPASIHSKCSSTPHLASSLSNSSGRSSVITPVRRPSYCAMSPTNMAPRGNAFLPGLIRDGKEHLQHTLRQLALDKYANVFREQEVDLDTFLTLTDDDLRDLGIAESNDRNEILVVVRTLNYCYHNQRRQINNVYEHEKEEEILA